MKYTQKTGRIFKSRIELDLQDTGLHYVFTDVYLRNQPRVDDCFISYTNITNQKIYSSRKHPAMGVVPVSTIGLIVAISFFAGLANYSSTNGFLASAAFVPSVILGLLVLGSILYIFSTKQKTLIVVENDNARFTLLRDARVEEIYKKIIEKRNAYLRSKFIDNNLYRNLTPEAIEYLASISAITQEESQKFKSMVTRGGEEKLGFTTGIDDSPKS